MINKKINLVDKIKQDIMSTRFPPGMALRVSFLKSHYEVGATPIREALCYLASTGLVVETPNCGFTVHAISMTELFDLYKSRLLLEKVMVESSAKHPNADWEAKLTGAFYQLNKLETIENNDREYEKNWEIAHSNFHQILVENCQLETLKAMWAQLYLKTERYRKLWFSGAPSREFNNSIDEHNKLYSASITYDYQTIFSLLEIHYQAFLEHIQKIKPKISELEKGN